MSLSDGLLYVYYLHITHASTVTNAALHALGMACYDNNNHAVSVS